MEAWRDNAQAILDLADCRLREESVTDAMVRHDLKEIVGLAKAMLLTVGAEPLSANEMEALRRCTRR